MKPTKLVALAVIALALLSVPVYADTITIDNVQFTASVTSTTVTLQIQCLTASCSDWYLGDVTLKGFSFTGTPILGSAPSGYTLEDGGQNNKGVGNGGGCNGSQPGNALCWSTSTPLTIKLGGGSSTFTATIAGGVVNGDLHVQATAYDNQPGTQKGGGKVLAVSEDLDGGRGGSGHGGGGQVPEPSSMALFGTGLLIVSGLLRRQIKH
jgi:hypothetical protein